MLHRNTQSPLFLESEPIMMMQSITQATQKVPIVYSPRYNVTACGLEKSHPFDTCKYANIVEDLVSKGTIARDQVVEPKEATCSDLKRVHSLRYLATIHWLNPFSPCFLSPILSVPVCCVPSCVLDNRVLKPMRLACGGTMLAVELALRYGWAINLSGGYHHASRNIGGGFCVYADITMAVQTIHTILGNSARVLIIDLDAHQGNGHERDLGNLACVHIIDAYNGRIYPQDSYARRFIHTNLPFKGHDATDATYLKEVGSALTTVISDWEPEFILFNAGTDCLEGDPLGGMHISKSGIIARDELVFGAALRNSIPVVMLLSGGYQRSTAGVIAESIRNLDTQFNLLHRGPVTKDSNLWKSLRHMKR